MAHVVDLVAESVLEEVARLFVREAGDQRGAIGDVDYLHVLVVRHGLCESGYLLSRPAMAT